MHGPRHPLKRMRGGKVSAVVVGASPIEAVAAGRTKEMLLELIAGEYRPAPASL